jgi:plasmid stabilization system protein ParE
VAYRVRIALRALRHIDEFAAYLAEYNEAYAVEQISRLDQVLSGSLAQSPLTWSYFPLTGAPYRDYLFRVGRRTRYWIIYTVDENAQTVDVLHFWNTRRDPERLEL